MEDVFEVSAPQLDSGQIERIAQEQFGALPGVKLYPGERDQNARCALPDGREIVVKIMNSAETRETIAFQQALLDHVHRVDPGIGLPHVVRAQSDEAIVTVDGPAGARHLTHALSWIKGVPLAEADMTPALQHSLGHALGRLSAALQGFFHPTAWRPDFLWNLDNAATALAWRGAIADAQTRDVVEQLTTGSFAALPERLAPLRQAVLYQDANDYNVIVTDGAVAGFIDFGDVVFGRQINELAIALAYAAMDKADPLAVMAAITRGYAQAFPIEPAEIDVLHDLVMLRLAQSICISSHRAAEFTENEYLTISQAPASRLLQCLEAMDRATVRDHLAEAAGLATRPDWEAHPEAWSPDALLSRRKDRIAPSLSVAYRKPLTIVRGKGARLYDQTGRAFLDMVNNVAHVGHCHPHVTRAIAQQAAVLNTNARYLHKTLLDYADRITATMPPQLSVCIFTCSGSEANELAMRMARTATGRFDAVVLDMAYHGHTTSLVDISPYKFARKGGQGRKPFVHVAPMPYPYRGLHRGKGEEVGQAYGAEVAAAVARSASGPAFFIAESFLGVGGQVILPPGFLKAAYAAVRAAGGLCIADEVQVGFGRPGNTMWAFEDQGVIPDIVTLGKPIGAGHPMAAVVTTPEIARAFANGMEYFNTFGGNPVSCAAGMAVLDVIEEEGLLPHAQNVGAYLVEGLDELARRYPLIGDVRGRGLFVGAELVEDRAVRSPARAAAGDVVNRMRDRGILLSTDGPDDNVIKIKPPMVFSRDDATQFLETFDQVLAEVEGVAALSA